MYSSSIIGVNDNRLCYCSRGGIDIDIYSIAGIDIKIYDLNNIFDEISITEYRAKYTSDTSIAIFMSNGLKIETYVAGRISCFVSDKFIDSYTDDLHTNLDEYYKTIYILFLIILILIMIVVIFTLYICVRYRDPNNEYDSNIDGIEDPYFVPFYNLNTTVDGGI